MNIKIREYTTEDAKAASEIWNQVVDDGEAFPQEEDLTEEIKEDFDKEDSEDKDSNEEESNKEESENTKETK